jgi:hypothetical protein
MTLNKFILYLLTEQHKHKPISGELSRSEKRGYLFSKGHLA